MQINDLDEFEISREPTKLGEGTFSEVYRVRSLKDGRLYALKSVGSPDQRKQSLPPRQGKPVR